MANDAAARSRIYQDSIADGLTKFFDTIPHDPNHYVAFSAIQDGIIPFIDPKVASDPRLARNLLFLLVSRFTKIYRQAKPYCFRRLTKEEIALEKQQQKFQKKQPKSVSVDATLSAVGADLAPTEQAAEMHYVCAAVAKYFDEVTDISGKYTTLPQIRVGVSKYLPNSNNHSDEVLEQMLLVALRQDPLIYQERPSYYQFKLRSKNGKDLYQQKAKAVDGTSAVDSPPKAEKAGTKPIVTEAHNKGKELLQVLKSKSIGRCILPSSSTAAVSTPVSSSSSSASGVTKGLPADAMPIEDSFLKSEPRPNMPLTIHIVQGDNISDIESIDTDFSTLADMINDELIAIDRSRGYHSEEEYWQRLMTKGTKQKTLPVLPKVIKHVEPVIDTNTAAASIPPPPIDHWHMKNVTAAQMNNTSKLFQCRLLLHIS